MKVAIQQPYFYPYLGYFKLIESVDTFVFLNDVQYIRRGWVNRNRISDHFYLTVPVIKDKQTQLINKMKIDYSTNWHHKHCRTIETRYGKKCLDHPIYTFYKNIPMYTYLVDLLKETIVNTSRFLGLKTKFLDSEMFENQEKGQKKIISICNQLGAKEYWNLPGGKSLYSDFDNINLNFLDINIHNRMSILDLCIGEELRWLNIN